MTPNLLRLFLLSLGAGLGISALWIIPILIWKRPKVAGWQRELPRQFWAAPVWLIGCGALYVFTASIPPDSVVAYYLVVVAATASAAVAAMGHDRDMRWIARAFAAGHIMTALASGGLWIMGTSLAGMKA